MVQVSVGFGWVEEFFLTNQKIFTIQPNPLFSGCSKLRRDKKWRNNLPPSGESDEKHKA